MTTPERKPFVPLVNRVDQPWQKVLVILTGIVLMIAFWMLVNALM